MMLEVQKYLRGGGTLESLAAEFSISATVHPTHPLVILNYSQINSPKMYPVVRECRGLCLETASGEWNVAARSFPRFFNLGECVEDTARFDWSSFVAREKCDGSMMVLYWHGRWRVNTRGSFATGEICPGAGMTWEEVFWESGIDRAAIDPPDGGLSVAWSYVFELCSPFNKVVRRHERPTLFLLAAFHNATGREAEDSLLDEVAAWLRVQRPPLISKSDLNALQSFIDTHEDPTFEGVVVKDRNGVRLKVKNPRYVALHRMRGEGDNLYHPKNLLPFVLANEADELLTYFPEVREKFLDLQNTVRAWLFEMLEVWEEARHIPTQKEFALAVLTRTPFASLLFEARKKNADPAALFRAAGDIILKKLTKEVAK